MYCNTSLLSSASTCCMVGSGLLGIHALLINSENEQRDALFYLLLEQLALSSLGGLFALLEARRGTVRRPSLRIEVAAIALVMLCQATALAILLNNSDP